MGHLQETNGPAAQSPGPRRGRRAVILGAFGGFLALAVAVVAARRTLLERWHIHRLRSGDIPAARSAAAWLGEDGTARAVDPLVASVEAEGPEASAPLEALGAVLPHLRGDAVERAVDALLRVRTWGEDAHRMRGRSRGRIRDRAGDREGVRGGGGAGGHLRVRPGGRRVESGSGSGLGSRGLRACSTEGRAPARPYGGAA